MPNLLEFEHVYKPLSPNLSIVTASADFQIVLFFLFLFFTPLSASGMLDHLSPIPELNDFLDLQLHPSLFPS